ncbi:hypothetical protein, partial [Nocardia gipuzkoensis]|uniref:hypothetical protein n=1 Tax=Nocardia gipuzkoensis TaxID=2749991 RepID=UPI002456BE74
LSAASSGAHIRRASAPKRVLSPGWGGRGGAAQWVYGTGARPPRPTTPCPPPARGGEPGESTRFGALARRMWAPLLAAESQGQP